VGSDDSGERASADWVTARAGCSADRRGITSDQVDRGACGGSAVGGVGVGRQAIHTRGIHRDD
jgi:hypothetical protein